MVDGQDDNERKNKEGILNGGKIRPSTSNGLGLTEYNQSQPQILKMEAPGTPNLKERKNGKGKKTTWMEN